ncbi:fibrillarin-like rRNA/tRNA 2'-O-methyltransferase [Nanoarchaeota archaeon]
MEIKQNWDPNKSKVVAALKKGIKSIDIKKDDHLLYLGASSGTTVSYLAELITEGIIFAIDISPETTRQLLIQHSNQVNIAPILADANHPETYSDLIMICECLYQDIAQKNQVEILFKNLKFLKDDGLILFNVKARSIDVSREPQQIFDEVEKQLKEKLEIIDKTTLEPYQKDHCFFVCKKLDMSQVSPV